MRIPGSSQDGTTAAEPELLFLDQGSRTEIRMNRGSDIMFWAAVPVADMKEQGCRFPPRLHFLKPQFRNPSMLAAGAREKGQRGGVDVRIYS